MGEALGMVETKGLVLMIEAGDPPPQRTNFVLWILYWLGWLVK